jgi:hypothetical protein
VHLSTLPCSFPHKLTIPCVIGLCFEIFQCRAFIKNMDIELQGGYQLGYVLTLFLGSYFQINEDARNLRRSWATKPKRYREYFKIMIYNLMN